LMPHFTYVNFASQCFPSCCSDAAEPAAGLQAAPVRSAAIVLYKTYVLCLVHVCCAEPAAGVQAAPVRAAGQRAPLMYYIAYVTLIFVFFGCIVYSGGLQTLCMTGCSLSGACSLM
jgi:hypothetical protein